jgi:hypothetical protein
MDWESTVGGWANTLVDAAAKNYTNQNAAQAASLKLNLEGQALRQQGTIAGLPATTVLLIGGVLVLVLMLKD